MSALNGRQWSTSRSDRFTPALNTTGKKKLRYVSVLKVQTHKLHRPTDFCVIFKLSDSRDVYAWVVLQPVTCLSSLPIVDKWVCNICRIVEECISLASGKSVPVLFCPPCIHMDPGRCGYQKLVSVPNKAPDESHSLSAFLWNWLFVPPAVNAR